MLISVAKCNCHFLIVTSNCSHIEEMNVIFFFGMYYDDNCAIFAVLFMHNVEQTRLYYYSTVYIHRWLACLPSCLRENLEQIAN